MNACSSLAESLSIGVLVVGAVTFIGKTIVSKLLERDVLLYKSNLDRDTSNALADYKAALEKERIRLQISYGGIFEKQAETILELYRLLTRFERRMHFATLRSGADTEYSQFIEIWQALMETYEERQILLTEEIDAQFGDIAKGIFEAVHDIRRTDERIEKVGHALSQQQFDRLFANQDRAYEILNQIPSLKKDLKAQLRKLIGIQHAQENIASDP